jgi:hypothetical protein
MYCITGTGRSQIALTVGRKQLGAKLECRKGYLRDIYKNPGFKGIVRRDSIFPRAASKDWIGLITIPRYRFLFFNFDIDGI